MKCWFTTFFIILNLPSARLQASELGALAMELAKTAEIGSGISKTEEAIAEKFWEIGSPSIPYLLPLLRHENEEVAALAAYILRDIKDLREEHLDQLIESSRRGTGWIEPAIAKIGTPKAISFLVNELVRERETQTQLTWAIKMIGAKAVPDLMRVYQGETDWDNKLENTMAFTFKELGVNAVTAIYPLMEIANDQATAPERRIRAIAAVGFIGLPAERAVPDLQALQQQSNQEISAAATSAIVNIGSKEAGPILAAKLEHTVDSFGRMLLMRDIAELKARARSAGPIVIKYLKDEDWNVRVGAALVLGYIGYDEAVDNLIQLLDRQDDWRLVWCAAESLGRLKADQALAALTKCSIGHWYPPVRKAALNAVKSIRDRAVTQPDDSTANFAFEFFAYEHAGQGMDELEEKDAKSIRFQIDTTHDKHLKVTIKDKDGTLKDEQLKGLEVEGGQLVGYDFGEFGGGIFFVDSTGDRLMIAEENTEAVYRTTAGIVAITGLAHMSMNHGSILMLTRSTDAKWTSARWRALPGAPRFSRLLQDGRLLINCYGGIVLVSMGGEMKVLTRDEALK
jgi:HEAT repeat protein